jgi:hypothetical protein
LPVDVEIGCNLCIHFFICLKTFYGNGIHYCSDYARIGTTNQGEKEVAHKGGVMTKVVTQDTPAGAVKVSRAIVELINELSEVRAVANSANARVEELRKAIFSEVGKADLTLIHHNIEVARIVESAPMRVNEAYLAENWSEAYEDSRQPRQQFTIRSVTRRA